MSALPPASLPKPFASLSVGLLARNTDVGEHSIIKVFQQPSLPRFFELNPQLPAPLSIKSRIEDAKNTGQPRRPFSRF